MNNRPILFRVGRLGNDRLAMARHLVQHVVQKGQAGIALENPGTIQVHGDLYLGFLGVSLYCCFA